MTPFPDLLLTGARVYTADPRRPWAEAVLIRGEHIHFVGSEAEARRLAGAGSRRIDLLGGLLLPGFNDSHIHTNFGARCWSRGPRWPSAATGRW